MQYRQVLVRDDWTWHPTLLRKRGIVLRTKLLPFFPIYNNLIGFDATIGERNSLVDCINPPRDLITSAYMEEIIWRNE
jgi:hypothetical protein